MAEEQFFFKDALNSLKFFLDIWNNVDILQGYMPAKRERERNKSKLMT